MDLDVRLPMGAMFVLLGGVLTVYGAFSDRKIYRSSLGVNVNLWWGLVILAFGVLMLLLAWWGRASARNTGFAESPADRETPPQV